MKKRKPSAQQPGDFKNSPFKSLKGLTPQPAAAEKKALQPRKKREEKEEDAQELFLRAVAGARKIENHAAPAGGPVTKKITSTPDAAVPKDHQLFLDAMQKIGTSFRDVPRSDEEEPGQERRSASSRMKQLKRGTIRISRELDLHGYLKEEALKQLERFIADGFNRGQQAVLVITGKGINSPEGPVLQGAVNAWLRERGKGMVAEFAPAPRDQGGSGAVVVFLKKKY